MSSSVVKPAQALMPLRLSAFPGRGATESSRREYGVTFISSGYVQRRDGAQGNWRIPAETLLDAVPLLEGVACFVDHAAWYEMPSMRNLAGVTFGPNYASPPGEIQGGLRLYEREDLVWLAEVLDQLVEDQAAGREVPDVGLSVSFFGRHDWVDAGDEPGEEMERVTREITHVESCDIVFGPGANGRVREILSKRGVVPQQEVCSMADEVQVELVAGDEPETPEAARPEPAAEREVTSTPSPSEMAAAIAGMGERVERLTSLLAEQFESRAISDMGVAPRDAHRARPLVGGVMNSRDQIERAYEQLMGLPVSEPVHRLSGIRELYLLLTGDRAMQGRIDLDLVPEQLAYSNTGANADTTTMAELTRNVMNKALVAQLDLLGEYQWWRTVARVDNFNTLQQVSWVRYGGIGYGSGTGLPTVAEKGEYQQLYWEDERTTGTWVKKGGYLPLSMEMIDRDDLQGWRDVPRQLAVAEAVTISSVVSALFTDNSGAGADLSDGVGDGYAFNTTRGNLITQPLDQTNWDTAVDTMYKLSQLMNSNVSESRRIAARPRFVLVPIELESQAITAVTSAVLPSTPGDRRPTKRILPEGNVITVPHWTNADNWAAVADPALVPFVGVAFRFGETPEIFMPADSNHVLWLHDVLPVKVRWFFAVSVIDPRGAIKSNLS